MYVYFPWSNDVSYCELTVYKFESVITLLALSKILDGKIKILLGSENLFIFFKSSVYWINREFLFTILC